MGKIIGINDDVIEIGINNKFYTAPKSTLNFSAKIGDLVEVYFGENKEIKRVVKIRRENVEEYGIKSNTLSSFSRIFSYLGIFPLIFIGSIVGLITSYILKSRNDIYYGHADKTFKISIGGFVFWAWVLFMIIVNSN